MSLHGMLVPTALEVYKLAGKSPHDLGRTCNRPECLMRLFLLQPGC